MAWEQAQCMPGLAQPFLNYAFTQDYEWRNGGCVWFLTGRAERVSWS
jgi:hypothetical protein